MNLHKQVLAWLGSLFLVVTSVFVIASTSKVLNTATTTNTVSVQGEGKVLAKPDVAVVNFSIVTDAATSKAAQDANSPKSKAVTDFLKKQGVEDKDVKTTGYNISPVYKYYNNPCPVGIFNSIDYPCGGSQKIAGYQVTQSFEIKIRDLDKASTVVDGLVIAGANGVGQLQFTIDDPEKLKDEARDKAIADAKEKAEKLKNQIGIRLGRIINFSENTGGYYAPYYDKAFAGSGAESNSSPSLPAGENEIVVNVTLTYQIK